MSRLEFHFTPKHASWLNVVEIEIGVMVRQYLNRRLADKATRIAEIATWERHRNGSNTRRWKNKDPRSKLGSGPRSSARYRGNNTRSRTLMRPPAHWGA